MTPPRSSRKLSGGPWSHYFRSLAGTCIRNLYTGLHNLSANGRIGPWSCRSDLLLQKKLILFSQPVIFPGSFSNRVKFQPFPRANDPLPNLFAVRLKLLPDLVKHSWRYNAC